MKNRREVGRIVLASRVLSNAFAVVSACLGMSLMLASISAAQGTPAELENARRREVTVRSSRDKTDQPCIVIEPTRLTKNDQGQTPLLVALHTWSSDYQQRSKPFEEACMQEGWIYLHPNFRGPNRTPSACGSELAQHDILDAVAWAEQAYSIDPKRIYLTGVSGGGHMTMLMAGRYPKRWTACSAWVGISDLAAWHAKHRDTGYGKMMRLACGGKPGDSSEVDKQYEMRSPLTYLAAARDVPLDIAAGIHDGHTGSVPIRHSLEAYNKVASARKDAVISEQEMQELSTPTGRLSRPLKSDQVEDEALGREIYLRRQSGSCRVTIFEGGHEGVAAAAFAWLKRFPKPFPEKP